MRPDDAYGFTRRRELNASPIATAGLGIAIGLLLTFIILVITFAVWENSVSRKGPAHC